jgi:hypothetical protein
VTVEGESETLSKMMLTRVSQMMVFDAMQLFLLLLLLQVMQLPSHSDLGHNFRLPEHQ